MCYDAYMHILNSSIIKDDAGGNFLRTSLLIATIILAFCSIVYELLIGQTLSAFLGNTILRYSITIGLYMFSMGIGAYLAEGKYMDEPAKTLILAELALTIFGGGVVVFLFLVDAIGAAPVLFSLIAHSLIVIIGILTGFEIPLLIALANKSSGKASENKIIAVDYLGAFAGALAFAFYFYPTMGLVQTSFVVGLLNATVGFIISFLYPEKIHTALRSALALSIVFLLLGVVLADDINSYMLELYLS